MASSVKTLETSQAQLYAHVSHADGLDASDQPGSAIDVVN